MKISEDEIHLWFAYDQDISEPELLNHYHAIISEEEREQQQRFYFEKHRHQYLITRTLVRTTLSYYSNGIKPEQWEFNKNFYGKPFIKNPLNLPLRFNLAHTEGVIVLAINLEREVGVDVEWLGRGGQTVEIAQRFFSQQEIEQLLALPVGQQQNRFFDLWTLKEAYIKACGMGLSIPLDQFTFHFPQDDKIAIKFSSQRNDHPRNWRFWQFQPNKTHKIALALCGRENFSHSEHCSLLLKKTVPLKEINEIKLPYFLRACVKN